MNKIQIVGPSFTSYSLAQVNRSLAVALSALGKYQVQVVSNEEFAERDPSGGDLENYPELKPLITSKVDPDSCVIYNNFPRDPNGDYGINKVTAKLKIVYIAWEESIFPTRWINEFNQYAHTIVASSNFVREVLVRSGLKIPIFVVPNAIDDTIRTGLLSTTDNSYPLKTTKRYKFLHISSGYPRKGTDILIKAYTQEFTAEDDVCLVIKSLPHPLNLTPKWISENQGSTTPEIELINTDLSRHQLSQLIKTTNAGVYPTRAEGFGLPLLETMLAQKPLITTGYGAQLDFCNEQNSTLIDYRLVPAHDSQLANLGGMWADPDLSALGKAMRKAYAEGVDTEKLQFAQQTALQYTWQRSATMFSSIVSQLIDIPILKTKKLVVLSERNNKSGIAEHTLSLHTNSDKVFTSTTYFANSDVPDLVTSDSENIVRNWSTGEIEFTQVIADLLKIKPDLFHIEYHSGYFQPARLAFLIEAVTKLQIPTVLTLHAANTGSADIRPYAKVLNKTDLIIVHSETELRSLQAAGFTNTIYMVLGNITAPQAAWRKLKSELGWQDDYPIIATHGLLTELKGIGKLIEATASLKQDFPRIKLLLLNAVSSNNVSSQSYYEQYQKQCEQLEITDRVLFCPEFLSPAQILALLSTTDINILAYEYNGEAASAAVQRLIAADRPMILTAVPPFSAMRHLALEISDNDPQTIAKAIKQLLSDKLEQNRQQAQRSEYLAQHNWYNKQLELLKLYAKIIMDGRGR